MFDEGEPLNVSICHGGRREYVRVSGIPGPYLSDFQRALYRAQAPGVEGEGECAYAHDWQLLLQRQGPR